MLDLKNIILSDELHFNVMNKPNRPIFRKLPTTKPEFQLSTPLHFAKGAALIITKELYFAMLEHIFQDEQNSDIWFQHDGASAHTALMAMEWLKSRFQNQIISGRNEFPWPDISLKLSPLIYFDEVM